MRKIIPLFATGIVPRLRLVFVGIAVVLISALAIGAFQMRTLTQSVRELTVSTVSVFVRTEETERSLKNLLLHLRRIESVTDQSELVPLKGALQSELSRLRGFTANFVTTGQVAETAKKMVLALDAIENGAVGILASQEAIFVHLKKLSQLEDELQQSRHVTRRILEDMSFISSRSGEGDFKNNDSQSQQELDQIELRYSRDLILSNAITEISLEFESMNDTVLGLQSNSDAMELGQAESAIRFKIRNIVLLVSQFPKSANQQAIAAEISKIRDIVFGRTGIVTEVTGLQKQRASTDNHAAKQFNPVNEMSILSQKLMQDARSKIENARLELELTTDRIIAIILSAAIISFGVIGMALFFIVEVQINKRMAQLTNAVLGISKGEVDYDVGVHGSDELGEMASALEVFKLNAKELHRSNNDLEKFAYVAAHDLRSPLRAIQDLAQWTIEDTDNVLTEDSNENLRLLQARIERLSKLLSDLLKYAAVGQEKDDLSEISMKKVVKQTAEMLDPNHCFQITFSGPDDVAVTYATPLRQIMLNLINNAIKHHDRSSGSIDVEMHLLDGNLLCSVKDDGPGIAPQYHDRIFGLFKTLRSRDEVEGSGLGLAIIRKLVEHYDGAINVHSDPEHTRGSTFVFDMPEKTENIQPTTQAA